MFGSCSGKDTHQFGTEPRARLPRSARFSGTLTLRGAMASFREKQWCKKGDLNQAGATG